MVANKHDRAP